MDQSNFRNMLLAYHAVHDEVLCESMDELGFFDGIVDEGYMYEGYKRYPDKRVAKKIDRMYDDPNIDILFGNDARRRNEMRRVYSDMKGEVHPLTRAHSPKISKAKSRANKNRPESEKRSRTVAPQSRFPNLLMRSDGQGIHDSYEYKTYEAILAYLLDERYADSLESAEAIIENMSDAWLEEIIEARDGYGDDSKFKGDTDADSFIPGKTVPKPKSYGRLSRFAPSALSGERSRTASNVRRTVGESPNQPRAVQMPGETKAKRVIPSRFDKKK